MHKRMHKKTRRYNTHSKYNKLRRTIKGGVKPKIHKKKTKKSRGIVKRTRKLKSLRRNRPKNNSNKSLSNKTNDDDNYMLDDSDLEDDDEHEIKLNELNDVLQIVIAQHTSAVKTLKRAIKKLRETNAEIIEGDIVLGTLERSRGFGTTLTDNKLSKRQISRLARASVAQNNALAAVKRKPNEEIAVAIAKRNVDLALQVINDTNSHIARHNVVI